MKKANIPIHLIIDFISEMNLGKWIECRKCNKKNLRKEK